jgi:hypothetical protein
VAGATINHPIVFSGSSTEQNANKLSRGFLIKLNAQTGAFESGITTGSSTGNMSSSIMGMSVTADGSAAYVSGYREQPGMVYRVFNPLIHLYLHLHSFS